MITPSRHGKCFHAPVFIAWDFTFDSQTHKDFDLDMMYKAPTFQTKFRIKGKKGIRVRKNSIVICGDCINFSSLTAPFRVSPSIDNCDTWHHLQYLITVLVNTTIIHLNLSPTLLLEGYSVDVWLASCFLVHLLKTPQSTKVLSNGDDGLHGTIG